MSIKCNFFGIHDWVIVDKGTIQERWARYYDGKKIECSEYTRDNTVVIEECSRCKKMRAWKGYGFPQESFSVEFARKEIARINGNPIETKSEDVGNASCEKI